MPVESSRAWLASSCWRSTYLESSQSGHERTPVNQPRRDRDTEICCVFVSLSLILSVLSASCVSMTRTRLYRTLT
jgi:hypothetical protein